MAYVIGMPRHNGSKCNGDIPFLESKKARQTLSGRKVLATVFWGHSLGLPTEDMISLRQHLANLGLTDIVQVLVKNHGEY